MKITIIDPNWIGGLMNHISDGFKANGHEVESVIYERKKSILRPIKFHNIVQIKNYLEKKDWKNFNKKVLNHLAEFKPDIFIVMNESHLLPSTVQYAKKKNCKTICFIADNPFDAKRFSYLPISLKYFDKILVHDKIWIPPIKKIAPKSQIIKIISGGGFNKNVFYPVNDKSITQKDRERFSCDVSFTGESYGLTAEGAYRAGILDQLGKYNVKIWGDSGWKQRFPYYDNLINFYQGGRVSYEELRKLYKLSIINLNMPSPQIFTGFQPRVFEIAACKGFQIVDWREELDELFSEKELVTFKNINDLYEKIDFFIKNPEERIPYIENMYNKVVKKFSWDEHVKLLIDNIEN